MRLLRWIANRRRPLIDACSMEWPIIKIGRYQLSLMVQFQSEAVDDYRPNVRNVLAVLAHGQYMHTIREPAHGIVRVDTVRAPAVKFYGKDSLHHIDLFDTTDLEESMLDLPGWMTYADVRRDTGKQAWFLTISW